MKKAFFVTGTDTDVGKTTISSGLLAKAVQQKLMTAAIKPIASGCTKTAQGLRNSDALTLLENTNLSLTYEEINPIAFLPAIAPHIAAQEQDIDLSVTTLYPYVKHVLLKKADFTLIEGAGGWRVPLNDTEYLSDLVKALALPVILVVGVRLGCVNHAVLTLETIQRDGLIVAGWIANIIDPQMARLDDNLQTLAKLIEVPCLGTIPYLTKLTATHVASYLSLDPLLGD